MKKTTFIGLFLLMIFSLIVTALSVSHYGHLEVGGWFNVTNSSEVSEIAGNLTVNGTTRIKINVTSCSEALETTSDGTIVCGTDSVGSAADWSKIQNYTTTSTGCSVGDVVTGRYQNGTFNCTTDQTSAFDPAILAYVNTTMLDNKSIVRDHNTTWVDDLIDVRVIESFLTAILNSVYLPLSFATNSDYINTTLFDNSSIVRSQNISWIYDSAPPTNRTDLDIMGVIQNETIIRTENITWIYRAIHTNRTDADINTTVDEPRIVRAENTSWVRESQHIWNDTDARFGLLNITLNITLTDGGNESALIWHNSSGICISSC